MRPLTPCLAFLATIATATAAGGQTVDELLQKFSGDAPQREAEVRIDAWIETGSEDGAPNRLLITLTPDGDTRLNADPGITVTPMDQLGVEWQVPLPYRHQDQTITYFEPPATVRMPFTASDDQPVEILVEYAYCLVDYQCFFGEETLRVAMVSKKKSS